MRNKLFLATAAAALVAMAALLGLRLLQDEDRTFAPDPEDRTGTAAERACEPGSSGHGPSAPAPAAQAPGRAAQVPTAEGTAPGLLWTGRVEDRDTGSPLPHFLLCPCRLRKKGFHDLPAFNPFDSFEALAARLRSSEGAVEMRDPDGAFSVPFETVAGRKVFFLAPGHAPRLVDAGEGPEPGPPRVIALPAEQSTGLRVLDKNTGSPVNEAELLLDAEVHIDLSPDGRTFGTSGISLHYPSRPGVRSDANGRISVPRFPGRSAVSLLIRKKGYVLLRFQLEQGDGEKEILLSPDVGSLSVEVVDEAGRPVPALVRLHNPLAWQADLYAVTDGQGRCTVHDLPPGRILLFATRLLPDRAAGTEPGALLPWKGEMHGWTGDSPQSPPAEAHIVPGGREHAAVVWKPVTKKYPVLFGRLPRNRLIRSISLLYRSDSQSGGSPLPRQAPMYETPVAVEGRFRLAFSVHHEVFGPFQVDRGEHDLEPGKRLRLDLDLPLDLRLVRLRVRFPAPRPGQRLPASLSFTCIREGKSPVRTPLARAGNTMGKKNTLDLEAGVDLYLAPGTYEMEAWYPAGSGSFHSHSLGTVEAEGRLVEQTLELPWVALVDVIPVDESTGSRLEQDVSYLVARAGKDMTREENRTDSGRILEPGHYTVLVVCPGYSPAKMDFSVSWKQTGVAVKVPMERGPMGTLEGRVVETREGEAVTGRCDVRVFHQDLGLEIAWIRAQAGTFSLSGLPGGRYRLTVFFDGGKKHFPVTLEPDEKKTGLVLAIR